MRGLNKLYYIRLDIERTKKEIADIERQIASLPIISSPQITGMPHGTNVSNPIEKYYLRKEALREKLEQRKGILDEKLIELETEKIRLEGIIKRIDDPAVHQIAELRFIDNKSWEEISRETNYDRSVCYRKLKKYLDGMDI